MMKKIMGLLMCVLIAGSALGMEQPRCVRSKEEQHRLDHELYSFMWRLNCYELTDGACDTWRLRCSELTGELYNTAQELLRAGANPNGYEDRIPVLQAFDTRSLRLLVRYGADINAVEPTGDRTTVAKQFAARGQRCILALVWALTHGANPNISPAADYAGFLAGFPIHLALINRSTSGVVALLRYGAWLDVSTRIFKRPLQLAEVLAHLYNAGPNEEALYHMLKAVRKHKLTPSQMYSVQDLERMEIPYDSAVIIESAMREICDAELACAKDDIEYHWGQKTIQGFALNRPIGLRRRR